MDDLRSILFGPIYATWGTAANLTLIDGTPFTGLTAIDLTKGDAVVGTSVIETVVPTALMLRGDLDDAGATGNLDGGTLTLNGVNWRVTATRPLPTPNGEADGEVMFFLELAPP